MLLCFAKLSLRPDFTSKLEHGFAFGIPKFYIGPYNKINHGLVKLSYNCDMKSGLSLYVAARSGINSKTKIDSICTAGQGKSYN